MDTAAVRDNWVGRVIDGKFSLLRWLGGSASSDVFLTDLQDRGSPKAAIKLIRADAGGADAILNNWRIAVPLSHPHLIRLFHTGQCQIDSARLIYAVTEYAEENLSQIIPERPLTTFEVREMLPPVLDALSYLHAKGFVHGHVKPSNVMVVDNQLKLSCDHLQVVGATGERGPSPSVYDAPEIAGGAISPAADIWSLGVTLVEALTQHPPVWDRTAGSEPVVPESIPRRFAGIARECLTLDPAHRCSLKEISEHLDPTRPLPETANKTAGVVPAKLGITALFAALVLLGAVAAVKLRHHQTEVTAPGAQLHPVSEASEPPQSSVRAEKGVVKGEVAERVLPNVPRSASATIQGRVRVRIRVTVDSSGNVADAKFDSAGPSKYFANLALQSARKWKFKPAQVDGQAVSSVWVLAFQFRQSGTEVAPAEISTQR